MRQRLLGLIFGLCAAGMVQAQEVVDQLTIQVGTALTEYTDYGNVKSIGNWGYASDGAELLGALVLPAQAVDVRNIGVIRYKWVYDPDSCNVQLLVDGNTPIQLAYMQSITALKYGDLEFAISTGDGDKYIGPLNSQTVLLVQQKSCAFANAVEAAYPQGSIVNIAITREVADPLPPVVPATLGVNFSLRAGYSSEVPAIGGAVRHSRMLSNLGATDKPVLYWITTQLPGGSGYPLLTPRSVTVAAGSSFSELKTFAVPAWFPAGSYSARLVMVDPATGERVTADIPFSKSAN